MLAEKKLNEKERFNVELMNFGVGGYTQTEELYVLENYVQRFSPDMVMLFFHPPTDIADINKATATIQKTDRPFYVITDKEVLELDTSFSKTKIYKIKCSMNWLKKNSIIISFLINKIKKFHKKRLTTTKTAKEKKNSNKKDRIHGYLSLCTDNPDMVYLENYKLNKILIKQMVQYCKENKWEFVLVCLDTPAYITEREEKLKKVDDTFNLNFFDDDLNIYAKELGIDFIGLQRRFRQYYEETAKPLHLGHWDYQGHECVAETLVDKLQPLIEKTK